MIRVVIWMLVASLPGSAPIYPATASSSSSEAPVQVRPAEWWIKRWGLEEAWTTTRGRGVVVAVIDSGVQANLPELRGAVRPGVDLSGSGTDGRDDTDPDSHGTVVAELIAARARDHNGMVGVAPEAEVLPIRLGEGGKFQDAGGLGSANAIRWAVDHGASIINMSYGGPSFACPGPTLSAIDYALNRDVIIVSSAGNDGDTANAIEAPAVCAGVVSIGAVDQEGRPWQRTGRHDYVDLAAPGVDIALLDKGGRPREGDGTSYAAALVSGAVALLRARFPDMPARQIVTRLLATAKDAGPPGKDDQTGYGIVRPLNALTENVPADAPNPVYEEVDRLRGVTAPQGGHARSARGGSKVPLIVGLGGAGAVLGTLVVLLARRPRRSLTAAPPYPPGWRPPPKP